MWNFNLSLLLILCAWHPETSLAAERLAAKGKVVDAEGNPVEQATVLVYSAYVKGGFNVVCPTCYVDCGKRALTGPDGIFEISGLSPDLVFNLLAVREGFTPTFVNKVDPASGSAVTAVLKIRTSPENPAQFVRGKVVDVKGAPIPGALVEQQGVAFANGARRFGGAGWIDLIAVTNENGEFEIAHTEPAVAFTLLVSPRAKSPKLVTLPTGLDRKTITNTDGTTIRGRLTHNGGPVEQAEVGLRTYSSIAGETYPEVRIGTNAEGAFAITNVPPGRVWSLYAKVDSLARRGLYAEPIVLATKGDGQETDVGDIRLKPAYELRGKVILSDGKQIPRGMRINLFWDRRQNTQTLTLPADGSFEFDGVGRGVYQLAPAIKGYELQNPDAAELLVEGNVSNLTVIMQPAATRR